MKRRGFLQLLGVGSAAAVVPAIAKTEVYPADWPDALKYDLAKKWSAECKLGLIRECMAFEIEYNAWLLRYDIQIPGDQLSMDSRFKSHPTAAEFKGQREIAVIIFGNMLQQRGYNWTDVTHLEAPGGLPYVAYFNPEELA